MLRGASVAVFLLMIAPTGVSQVLVVLPDGYDFERSYPSNVTVDEVHRWGQTWLLVDRPGGGLVLVEARNGTNATWHYGAVLPGPAPIPEPVNLNPVIWEVQDQASALNDSVAALIQASAYNDSKVLKAVGANGGAIAGVGSHLEAHSATGAGGGDFLTWGLLVLVAGLQAASFLGGFVKGRSVAQAPEEGGLDESLELLSGDGEE